MWGVVVPSGLAKRLSVPPAQGFRAFPGVCHRLGSTGDGTPFTTYGARRLMNDAEVHMSRSLCRIEGAEKSTYGLARETGEPRT